MQDSGTEASRDAGPSILIVDDYQDLAESLARLIRRMGFSADIVLSGKAAIALLEQHHPQLLIVDLLMPFPGGIDLLRYVRSKPELQSIPVIVYTGSSDEELLSQAVQAGATEVWLKGSLDFFEMLARISKHMKRPG